ncbi:MAG: ribosome silencing factor [Proteobacteria bacterium]|nr:ribosome silencing factor [Pseudomonadota bacterium]
MNLQRARALLDIIQSTLDNNKAFDVVTVNLDGKTDIAYYMVVASGMSSRHVGALAEKLAEAVRKTGLSEISIEGLPEGDWVVMDNPYVVVHLFRPEAREYYNLEKMWQADFSEAQHVAYV